MDRRREQGEGTGGRGQAGTGAGTCWRPQRLPRHLGALSVPGAAEVPPAAGAAVLGLLPVGAAGKRSAGVRDPQRGAPAQPRVPAHLRY